MIGVTKKIYPVLIGFAVGAVPIAAGYVLEPSARIIARGVTAYCNVPLEQRQALRIAVADELGARRSIGVDCGD